jgi:hypothetical protein
MAVLIVGGEWLGPAPGAHYLWAYRVIEVQGKRAVLRDIGYGEEVTIELGPDGMPKSKAWQPAPRARPSRRRAVR